MLRKQWLAVAAGLAIGVALAAHDAHSQVQQQAPNRVERNNRPPCWYVPNGSNVTFQCANGYWQTTTPDGETFTGNGMPDPNASSRGSTINIDPTTGGPVTNINRGPAVSPGGTPNMIAPGQAQTYGYQPRLD